MKKTKEIIGLPIISIFDGTEIGMVKNIIINAEDRSISFIVVENGLHLLGAKVISTDRLLGIGEHAVTVEDENVISMISKIPAAMDLLEKNVQIRGSKVLTKKGRLVGEITEIYVDEEDRCRIRGMEFLPLRGDGSAKFLPDKCIVTYGRHLVIILDAYESMLADMPDLSSRQYNVRSAGEANRRAPEAVPQSNFTLSGYGVPTQPGGAQPSGVAQQPSVSQPSGIPLQSGAPAGPAAGPVAGAIIQPAAPDISANMQKTVNAPAGATVEVAINGIAAAGLGKPVYDAAKAAAPDMAVQAGSTAATGAAAPSQAAGATVAASAPLQPAEKKSLDGVTDVPLYSVDDVSSHIISRQADAAPAQISAESGQISDAPGQKGVSQIYTDTAPDIASAVPSQLGVAPGQLGVAPDFIGVPPDFVGVPPDFASVPPGQIGDVPIYTDAAPSQVGVAPDLLGVAPDSTGIAPDLLSVEPDLAGVSPGITGVSPDLAGVSPGPAGAASLPVDNVVIGSDVPAPGVEVISERGGVSMPSPESVLPVQPGVSRVFSDVAPGTPEYIPQPSAIKDAIGAARSDYAETVASFDSAPASEIIADGRFFASDEAISAPDSAISPDKALTSDFTHEPSVLFASADTPVSGPLSAAAPASMTSEESGIYAAAGAEVTAPILGDMPVSGSLAAPGITPEYSAATATATESAYAPAELTVPAGASMRTAPHPVDATVLTGALQSDISPASDIAGGSTAVEAVSPVDAASVSEMTPADTGANIGYEPAGASGAAGATHITHETESVFVDTSLSVPIISDADTYDVYTGTPPVSEAAVGSARTIDAPHTGGEPILDIVTDGAISSDQSSAPENILYASDITASTVAADAAGPLDAAIAAGSSEITAVAADDASQASIRPIIFQDESAQAPQAASQPESSIPGANVLRGEVFAADQQENALPSAILTDGTVYTAADVAENIAEESAAAQADAIESEATLFEQRQRKYLTGRIVTKTILDNKGNVLVEEGVRITEDIIDKVRIGGRMVQLVMNNRS